MSIHRRQFLKGLGLGAGAAFLSPVMQQAMGMQCFDSPNLPRRFVFVMQGNGIAGDYLTAPGAAPIVDETEELIAVPDLSGNDTNILSALAGNGSTLDLRPHATALLNVSNKIAGGGHTSYFRAMSCSKDPQETFDAWLARKLYVDAPFDAIRLGVTPSLDVPFQYDDMFLDQYNVAQPIFATPTEAFTGIFGSVGNGYSARSFQTDQHLLDFAKRDISAALSTFSGNSRERLKLETYLSSLERLTTEKTRLYDARDCLSDLVDTQGIAPQNPSFTHECPLIRMEAQFELATAALLGQMSNVVVLTNSVGNAFAYTRYHSLKYMMEDDDTFSGEVPWRHGIAHEGGGIDDQDVAFSSDTARKILRQVCALQVENIARLARTLASVPEGDGTMLDHTVIVFLSDNGATHHSNAEHWPLLLLGGGALGLKTQGRSLVSPKFGHQNNVRLSQVYNTLGHAAGFNLTDWGGEPDKANYAGPVGALLR